MTIQEDDTEEEGSSESESSSEGDMNDEDAGKEMLQMLSPTSQESEDPQVSELTGGEPSRGEAGLGAPEEMKPVNDTGMEDMEVALGEAISTVGDLTPMLSQNTVKVHTPRRRC